MCVCLFSHFSASLHVFLRKWVLDSWVYQVPSCVDECHSRRINGTQPLVADGKKLQCDCPWHWLSRPCSQDLCYALSLSLSVFLSLFFCLSLSLWLSLPFYWKASVNQGFVIKIYLCWWARELNGSQPSQLFCKILFAGSTSYLGLLLEGFWSSVRHEVSYTWQDQPASKQYFFSLYLYISLSIYLSIYLYIPLSLLSLLSCFLFFLSLLSFLYSTSPFASLATHWKCKDVLDEHISHCLRRFGLYVGAGKGSRCATAACERSFTMKGS